MRRPVALAVATLVAAVVSCKAEEPAYSGFGPWRVTTTTLAKASGRCDPADLPDGRKGTYCYLQPKLPVAGQAADVDLYFGGTEPDAKLVELQLKIRVCKADAIDTWLRTNFGAPTRSAGSKLAFANRYMLLAAELPAANGGCMLRAFPTSEQAALERVLGK